jgi:hypothetical protein
VPLYLIILFLSIGQTFASSMSIQERWSRVSDPLIMNLNAETRLFALPESGQVKTKNRFWSGDYWPLNQGMINFRWNASEDFPKKSPTFIELKVMNQAQLAQLSPAEKFDILNARYDYPLHREVEKKSNPHAEDWEGICHGWAPASMNHNEPLPKVLKNPHGLFIPFGSSDIKGLISYFYAYPYQVANTHQVGTRCEETNECEKDLNAGAFHIILTNKIGLEGQGLIADVAQSKEVWNHPIYSYQSQVSKTSQGPKANSAPGTTRTVQVRTTITYTVETENYWQPVSNSNRSHVTQTEFRYSLEIDIYGQVIGGEWISKKRPDFLWTMSRPEKFSGNFARLSELLND